MKGIVKITLAALMFSGASAVQNKEAASLVSQALSMVEQGSEAELHLNNALNAMDKSQSFDSASKLVAVPIDEKRALTLKVSPTYVLDTVNSVTLKAFRKIVGYDTFESIRRKNRDEQKDISDYYNVTVSIMVRRRPADVSPIPKRDPYSPDGPASLASTLDKGFPYDD